MFSKYKITKHPDGGEIVDGKHYKPFWFGPHINVEVEKSDENNKNDKKNINQLKEFKTFSDERFEDFLNMFSDRVYIPEKLSNKYIYNINYSREQFKKDVDKVNTKWIRDYIKYEKFQGNPLYNTENNNNNYLETSELSESMDSDDTLSIYTSLSDNESSLDEDNEWNFDEDYNNSVEDDE